ncbi:unnamed protein product [Rotaria magnacalcarata]
MEILVDTGATNSIIHQSALLKIQHQPYYPVQQQFFLANQTSIMIKGYVNLEIKIQHIKTFVTAAVTTTLCCDVILGEDWINHYRVIIDRFKNKLEILGNKASVHLRTSSDSKLFSPSSIALKTTNDSVVHNYKNYKPMMKHCLSKRSHFINTLKNSSPQTPHVIQDIEKTIDEMIQHITDLSHKNKTRNVMSQYQKIFDTSSSTIALTSLQHRISTGDHPPINSIPYKCSLQQQQALKNIINQMERSNLIRPSSSPWSFPVILIKKKSGDYRFVVDYRKLNAITTKDSFPIPTIESTLQQLAGNSYFSKLDLRSGYFQIPISENDKPKTAFITTFGLWEFNVLPMGLTNAPPSFQRIMYNLIVNGREQYCLCYLDDIIIFSKTFNDHINHLQEILRVLDQHRFQLNPSKCSLMNEKIDYLGHSIDRHGITPLHNNIKAIRELPLPNCPTLKQANQFIGGIGFYRKFIKNFSKIAAPLHRVTNLTKDNKHNFKWGDEQRQAVQQLTQIITGPELVLDFPDPALPFTLSTDASTVGLGAVLKQTTEDNKIKIIYYLSRTLTKSESRYSTTELEALAMVWSIMKLRTYLLGKDFKVETDHCPLCQFHKKKSRNGRLDRWSIEILSEYNITEINYKKGKCHCDADLLSRYPLYDNENENSLNNIHIRKQEQGYLFSYGSELDDEEPDLQPIATINVVTRARNYDSTKQFGDQEQITSTNDSSTSKAPIIYNTRSRTDKLRKPNSSTSSNTIKHFIPSSSSINNKIIPTSSSLPPNNINKAHAMNMGFSMKKLKEEQIKDKEIQGKIQHLVNNDDYTIMDGIIYKLVLRGKTKFKLPWIPKSMIDQVLFLYHDHHTAAHLGNNKTSYKLMNKYYWPNMHCTITNYIKSCMKCSKHNYIRTKRPGKMNLMPMPNEVMGLVGMDYWGPTNSPTAKGNRYVITMTDYLSKFVFAKAVHTNSAQEAAEFFLDVCYHFGAPTKLITDQGSHFVAELTRTVIESCNTTHILATPYHPTSNAQTERFNATFAPALSKLISNQRQDWDDYLQAVIYAYNTSIHTTTTLTPFHLMFTRESQLLMDPKQLKVSLMKPNEYYDKVKKSRKLIIDYAQSTIQHQRILAKKRFDTNRPDPQYRTNDLILIRVINRTSKFQEKYEGPYRILDQKGPSTFIVKLEDPDSEDNPSYTKQVTTADMKHILVQETI